MYNFEVLIPSTLEEALSLKNQYKNNLHVLAGGTDLLVAYRAGRNAVQQVLSLSQINELKNIWLDEQYLNIGALATHSAIIQNVLVKEYFQPLIQSLQIIGSIQIRNLGTIGGNICNASPAADSLPILYCANAKVTLQSLTKTQQVPIKEFISGPGKINLETDSILTSIQIPLDLQSYRGLHLSLRQRYPLSINKVSVAALLKMSDEKIIEDIRISLGAVAPTIIRVTEAENLLLNKKPDQKLITTAARICKDYAQPITDVRSTIEYRKAMVEILAKRVLWELIDLK